MRDLQQETVDLLRHLIRFNTVNPPGNERAAQEFLARYLEGAGFQCELVGPDPGRPNLVARLRGRGDGPALCYLSHVDTVLADPEEWTHDPWAADLADGYVWGRGALDMKSQVAAEVVGAAAAAANGSPAQGDLVVACVVDEEAGGGLGARWLTEERPDLVRCDMVLNEGGGDVFEYGGRRLYPVCCAEKGVFRFELSTDGIAGHASIPRMGDNALLKMAPVLQRLADRQPAFDLTDEPRALLTMLGALDGVRADEALERVRAVDPRLALLVEPMLGVTLTPTRIGASEKVNVIPSHATVEVDCRVPPGLSEADVRRRIEEVLGPDGYRLDFRETVSGNRSEMDGALMTEIRSWVAEHDPGAEVVPVVLPGFTDSRWFRAAFPGCTAYGFCPQRHMTMYEAAPLIHAADERVDVRDLGYAASFFAELPGRLMG